MIVVIKCISSLPVFSPTRQIREKELNEKGGLTLSSNSKVKECWRVLDQCKAMHDITREECSNAGSVCTKRFPNSFTDKDFYPDLGYSLKTMLLLIANDD